MLSVGGTACRDPKLESVMDAVRVSGRCRYLPLTDLNRQMHSCIVCFIVDVFELFAPKKTALGVD